MSATTTTAKRIVMGLVLALQVLAAVPVMAGEQQIATLRGGVPLSEEAQAAPLGSKVEEGRVPRSYPMQPPLVPHGVRNYQIDLKANKCMACHARRLTEASLAPMVSVTHYMNRDGNFLAEVSPRRYFCLQCHVVQYPREPLVGNDFIDLDRLLEVKKQ